MVPKCLVDFGPRGFRAKPGSYLYIIMSLSCLLLPLTVATASASSPGGVYFEITPQYPGPSDAINITTYFQGGPFIGTHSHIVAGNQINVLLYEDGVDFSPNPPHSFTEDIGQLPTGVYQVTVSVKGSPSNPVELYTLSGSLTVKDPLDNWHWRNPLPQGNKNKLSGTAYANGTFVVVGEGGTILTSTDGVAWTLRTSGTISISPELLTEKEYS